MSEKRTKRTWRDNFLCAFRFTLLGSLLAAILLGGRP